MVTVSVVGFIFFQLFIGLAIRKRISSEEDYLVAGRSLGLGLSLFTVFATWFGAESCISASGASYRHGLSITSPEPFGYGLALIVMGTVFAKPLWDRKLTTLADLFRMRFSGRVERVAALMMAPTSLLWAAAQILAFGQIIAATSGMAVSAGVILSGTVVIAYTFVGGLLADAITDLIQGATLIFCLVVLLITFLIVHPDAISSLGDAFTGLPMAASQPHAPTPPWWEIVEVWAVPICGSVVAQELISRISAARSDKVARRSGNWGGLLYIAVGLIPLALGLMGRHLVPELEESDQILPLLASKYLPSYAYILFTGALVSIIISTVDSALLAAGALVSHNLVVPCFPKITERGRLHVARGTVVVLGVLACALAFTGDTVYELVEEASSFGSAGVLIIFLFGLFTRFGNQAAAIAALVSGIAMWIYGAHVAEWSIPYLKSISAALGAYLIVGLAEKGLERKASMIQA